MTASLLDELRALRSRPGGEEALVGFLASLPEGQREALAYSPRVLGRPCQLRPPGNHRVWAFVAGRGAGKSWAGSQDIRAKVESGVAGRVALVSSTAADARDVLVEGPSGLLALSPPRWRPTYEPSKRRLTWPNGATGLLLSAEEPERLRGPQFDAAWADEVGAWAGGGESTWDNLDLATRLGDHPTITATTTPRQTRLVRRLLSDPTTAVTRSTTYENASYLAASYLEAMTARLGGSRLGRQELLGELLQDRPGALFKREHIDAARVARAPELRRVVVSLDPSGSSTAAADEAGIIVAGVTDRCPCAGGRREKHLYILADYSGVMSPAAWAAKVREAYDRHDADRVIAERNFGADMVATVLKAYGGDHLPVKTVTASRGKAIRAEGTAAAVEQGRVHFVGELAALTDQCCEWDPQTDSRSPDRLDAMVWASADLLFSGGGGYSLSTRPRDVPILPRRWPSGSIYGGDR